MRFQVSSYATWFNDYIYQTDSGLEQDELPEFDYRQADARYYGVEGEITATLFKRDAPRTGGQSRGRLCRCVVHRGQRGHSGCSAICAADGCV